MGLLRSEWGVTERNREARFYSLTVTGRRQLALEQESWGRLKDGREGGCCGTPEERRMSWLKRLVNTGRSGGVEREIRRELDFHLAERTDAYAAHLRALVRGGHSWLGRVILAWRLRGANQ